jgi:protein-S-isoprenylcysteine O-methyltransferase Ste14
VWPIARIILFLAATLANAYISRRSLLRPRSHGFVRFFVFECIIILLLLNLPMWFADPKSLHQLTSWVLLILSVLPLVLGLRELTRHGQVDPSKRPEPELFEFERTSKLVSSGIFHYIRHPLYTSLLLLAWGLFFKSPSLLGGALATVATAGVVGMSLMDEAECLRVFDGEYREYMLQTKRFVPHVI